MRLKIYKIRFGFFFAISFDQFIYLMLPVGFKSMKTGLIKNLFKEKSGSRN